MCVTLPRHAWQTHGLGTLLEVWHRASDHHRRNIYDVSVSTGIEFDTDERTLTSLYAVLAQLPQLKAIAGSGHEQGRTPPPAP